MARLYNLARMTVVSGGTGQIALGIAVTGYLTFSQAGVTNGLTINYAINDPNGGGSEIGTAVYTADGLILTRTPTTSTNSNNPINVSLSAQVVIAPAAAELNLLYGFATTTTDNAISRFNGTSGGTQNSGVVIDDSNNISGAASIYTAPAASYPGTLGVYYGHTLAQGTQVFSATGTSAVPVSDVAAPSVSILYSNGGANTNTATYSLVVKTTSVALSHAVASLSEALDIVGGDTSFIEGRRSTGVLSGATVNGSAYGHVSLAQAITGATTPKYIIGNESIVIRDTSDAPVPSSFTTSSFMAAYLSSTNSANKPDCAYMVNPFSAVPCRVGFGVYGDTVDHTAFRNASTTCVYGLDLQPGAYSSAAIRLPNASPINWRNAANNTDILTMQLSNDDGLDLGIGATRTGLWSGNTERFRINSSGDAVVRPTVATPAAGSTSARLLFGTTAGFGIYYGSGAPTVSAAKGSLYLRSDGTTTNDRMYVNTNGTTTWTNVTTGA